MFCNCYRKLFFFLVLFIVFIHKVLVNFKKRSWCSRNDGFKRSFKMLLGDSSGILLQCFHRSCVAYQLNFRATVTIRFRNQLRNIYTFYYRLSSQIYVKYLLTGLLVWQFDVYYTIESSRSKKRLRGKNQRNNRSCTADNDKNQI